MELTVQCWEWFMKKNKTAGFTVIETVIAVAIVALLMVTAVVNVKNPV
jgi:prepilin-type N-terminal cleavage/methylation domain-containing protein